MADDTRNDEATTDETTTAQNQADGHAQDEPATETTDEGGADTSDR